MTQAETRTLGYALAGSLAVHVLLVVAFALWIGLASFHRLYLPIPIIPEEPEVTIVFPEIPEPPPPPDNYIRTTQNTVSPQAPTNPAFISDRNTVASAKNPATPNGDVALPTMEGVALPNNELANRNFRDGETPADTPDTATRAASESITLPVPVPTPAEPAPLMPRMKVPEFADAPKEEAAKDGAALAEAKMKALDTSLAAQEDPSAPKIEDQPPEAQKSEGTGNALPHMRTPAEASSPRAIPVAKPAVAKSGFRPETLRSVTKGTISNAGAEDSANAAATPKGRYLKAVNDAIEKKWHQYYRQRRDAAEPGKIGLRFFVNKQGKVEDFEFVFAEASDGLTMPLVQEFTLRAIQEAAIPPIPEDVFRDLPSGRLLMEPDVVIYP
jgi:outer membrane biosynthesis protein TonB